MKKTVILLSGKIKSGKNEAAKILQKYFEEKGLVVSQDYFAKALKEYCRDDFQIFAKAMNDYFWQLSDVIIKLKNNVKELQQNEKLLDPLINKLNELSINNENWFEDKTFITRSILQIVGTQIMRMRVNDNYWVNLMKDKCEKSESDIICVSDARFINEVCGMVSDKYDIITIRLMRDPNNGKSTHESETALDDFECFNYKIDNRKNGLKSFEKQIKMVASEIFENLNSEIPVDYLNNIFEPHIPIQKFIEEI